MLLGFSAVQHRRSLDEFLEGARVEGFAFVDVDGAAGKSKLSSPASANVSEREGRGPRWVGPIDGWHLGSLPSPCAERAWLAGNDSEVSARAALGRG